MNAAGNLSPSILVVMDYTDYYYMWFCFFLVTVFAFIAGYYFGKREGNGRK